jgi:hypothetical protein
MATFTEYVCDSSTESCSNDVMLLHPGSSGNGGQQITVTGGYQGGNNPDPNHLRLDLFYKCPGDSEQSVFAQGVKPDGVDGSGNATFNYPLDKLPNCGGNQQGQITALLNDGISQTPFPGNPDWQGNNVPNGEQTGLDVPAGPPAAAIVTPGEAPSTAQGCLQPGGEGSLADGCFLDWQTISLQGEGTGQHGALSDNNLQWSIEDSNGNPVTCVSVPTGCKGSTLELPQTPNHLPAGRYKITLTVTDPSTGQTDSKSVHIIVLHDGDRDGMPQIYEDTVLQPCAGGSTNLDNDPTNLNADYDNDGIPNYLEVFTNSGPCQAPTNYPVPGDFDPNTLSVSATGNYVTLAIFRKNLPRNAPLQSIVGTSITLVSIKGKPIGSNTAVTKDVSGQAFARAVGYTLNPNTGVAKFPKQGLESYIKSNFKLNQQLTFKYRAYSFDPAFTLTITDTPNVTP